MTGYSNQKTSKNFMVQGTILAVASIIVRLIGMVYRIPLTRIIGDEGMGLYGCAFEVYNIALLLSSYSLPLAVSKLTAARLAKKEYRNAHRVFKCSLVFAITAGLIIGCIVFFGAKWIASTVMNSPMSYLALQILAPCLFIVAIMGVIRGFFQGQGNMVPTAISQVIEQIVNAIISVVAGLYLFRAGTVLMEQGSGNEMLAPAMGAGGGTLGTVTGAAAGLIFLLIAYFAYRKHVTKAIQGDITAEDEDLGKIYKILLATILPVIASSALYNICGILDQALFNHVEGSLGVPYAEYTKLIGMYTGKFLLLINVPLAMANALASSSIPSITASVATGEERHIIHSKIMTAIRFSMLIAIPSFIGYLVLGSPILTLLFNDDRKQMAVILAIGSVCVVFYSLSTIMNAILQGLNRMQTPVKNACISLAIHIVLLLGMLYLGLGVYAVVIANTLFSVTMCILNQIDIRKTCGYRQEWKKTFFKPLIAAVVMGACTRGSYELLHLFLGRKVSTLFALVIAVIVYGIMLFVTKALDEEELLAFPKGRTLVRICKKMRLLR